MSSTDEPLGIFPVANLLPVDQWVYHLYAVRYMDHEGGRTLAVKRIVATQPSVEELSENAPHGCDWIEWDVIEERVAGPLIIGNWRGFPLYESGWETAARMKV